MAGTAYTRESGEAELQKGIDQLDRPYGSLFPGQIPICRCRFEQNAALNAPDRPTLFGGGEHGYIDYPFLPADPPGVKNKTASDTQAVFHALQIFRNRFLKMRRLR